MSCRRTAKFRAAHAQRRRFSTEDLVALRDAGLSRSAAARRLGVTPDAVRYRIRSDGLSWPCSPLRRVDDDLFAKLWACHSIPTQEIADRLGVTRQAVSWRAHHAGLPSRKHVRYRKCDDAKLTEMWLAGVKVADIARFFGYAYRSCVSQRVADLGLPRRVRKPGCGGPNGYPGTITLAKYGEMRMAEAMQAEREAAS